MLKKISIVFLLLSLLLLPVSGLEVTSVSYDSSISADDDDWGDKTLRIKLDSDISADTVYGLIYGIVIAKDIEKCTESSTTAISTHWGKSFVAATNINEISAKYSVVFSELLELSDTNGERNVLFNDTTYVFEGDSNNPYICIVGGLYIATPYFKDILFVIEYHRYTFLGAVGAAISSVLPIPTFPLFLSLVTLIFIKKRKV